MDLEIVRLTPAHLERLPLPKGLDTRAYFTEGSASFCVLSNRAPVFAGGITNLQWHRGEAWILPTPFMRTHLKSCYYLMKTFIPYIAGEFKFRRVQATCVSGVSSSLFRHLGFDYEATLSRFGPSGEACDMWCRVFEVNR